MSGLERSAYPLRARCRRLRAWVYLRGQPHRSFRLQLCSSQPAGVVPEMPRFNTGVGDMKLGRVVKNPWYKGATK